jgi:hypothetical protein
MIILVCGSCGHDVLPGQLYQCKRDGSHVVPAHVACPSERQIERARLWGRWR